MKELNEKLKRNILIKSRNGITLIVLVITIIILLILAGITTAVLTGDNGLLNEAGNAKQASEVADAIEEIQFEIMKSYKKNGTIDEDKINQNLSKINGLTYNDKVIDSNNKITKLPATVKLNGYVFTILEDGDVDRLIWIDNDDGSYTHSVTGTKVYIGDKVNYNEGTGYTYTTDTTKGIGGSVGDLNTTTKKYSINSKTYTTEDLTWRILGITQKGQIELISENPMSASNQVYLANEESYLYGLEQLNNMCNELYSNGKGAKSARSLNLVDIDKLANIKTDADKKVLSESYGTKWKYRFPSTMEQTGTRFMQYNINSGSGYSNNWTDITNNSYQTFRIPGTSNNTELNSANAGYSPEITYEYYTYKISQKITTTAKDNKKISDLLTKGNYF